MLGPPRATTNSLLIPAGGTRTPDKQREVSNKTLGLVRLLACAIWQSPPLTRLANEPSMDASCITLGMHNENVGKGLGDLVLEGGQAGLGARNLIFARPTCHMPSAILGGD